MGPNKACLPTALVAPCPCPACGRLCLCCSFSPDLANRLVPVQPNEEEALRRGSVLADTLFARLGSNSSAEVSTSSSSSDGSGQLYTVFKVRVLF